MGSVPALYAFTSDAALSSSANKQRWRGAVSLTRAVSIGAHRSARIDPARAFLRSPGMRCGVGCFRVWKSEQRRTCVRRERRPRVRDLKVVLRAPPVVGLIVPGLREVDASCKRHPSGIAPAPAYPLSTPRGCTSLTMLHGAGAAGGDTTIVRIHQIRGTVSHREHQPLLKAHAYLYTMKQETFQPTHNAPASLAATQPIAQPVCPQPCPG